VEIQLKDVAKMTISKVIFEGQKAYLVVEEIGSYFGQPERVETYFTRTHVPFNYELESELQRPAAQS
jgi:hypothetical protein